MDVQFEILDLLNGHHYVPVVTFDGSYSPLRLADYLLEKQVGVIEITLRTPQGLEAIQKLKEERPEMLVGAGTVTQADQVDRLKEINTDFLVSPGLTEKLLQKFMESGIPFYQEPATPSEVMFAREAGA